MNKDSSRYFKEIKTLLPAKGKYEKRFLQRIKERITEINDDNSNIDYDSIVDIMGKPTELIAEYYTDIDIDYLVKRLRFSGVVRKVAVLVLILALLITCVKFILLYDSYRQCIDSIVVREESIIYTEQED